MVERDKQYRKKKHKKATDKEGRPVFKTVDSGLYDDVEIKNHQSYGIIIVYFVLAVTLLAGELIPLFIPEAYLAEDILFISLIFVPLILMFVNLGILNTLRRNDWAKASTEGLELHVHNSFLFFRRIDTLIAWEKISQFGSREIYTKNGVVCHLLLRLECEQEIRTYNLDHLQGHGHPIVLAISKFKRQQADNSLEQELESAEKENYVDYILIGLFCLSIFSGVLSINYYDLTLIPYWFYLPIILAVGIVAFFSCLRLKLKNVRVVLVSVSFSFLSVLAFLLANYHFAHWNSSHDIRTYKVLKAHYRETKSHEVTGYILKIDADYGEKKIEFGLKQPFDLRFANEVDLYLHKGLFGFPVYKKRVPKNSEVSNESRN